MASSDCKMIVDGLRKEVIKSAIKATESEYDRGMFEAYAEMYNEACSAYVAGAPFSEMRADLKTWARAAITTYDALATVPTDYMRGIYDVASMLITE
jgi:hypothetical protein